MRPQGLCLFVPYNRGSPNFKESPDKSRPFIGACCVANVICDLLQNQSLKAVDFADASPYRRKTVYFRFAFGVCTLDF